jgi:hypothetical protein
LARSTNSSTAIVPLFKGASDSGSSGVTIPFSPSAAS